MQDKTKFIFIGLGAVIIVLLFLFFNSFQYAGKLKRDIDGLQEEKNSLNAQLSSVTAERKDLQEKLKGTKDDLTKLEKEKAAVDANLQALTAEREQLKTQVADLTVRLTQASQKGEQQVRPREVEEPVSASADAYWAGILKKKAELELKLEGVRADLRGAKLENEQLKREKDRLALDLQSIETDSKDSAREYSYAKKLSDGLTQELAREKTDKFQIMETLKALKTENKFLKQQLKIIYDRKTKLEDKYTQLQDKNAVLETNMAKMEAFVREKILQVDSLRDELGISASGSAGRQARAGGLGPVAMQQKDSVELAPIVVRPLDGPRAPAAAASRPATIIAVNRDSNFVIMNAGSSAGIKVGDQYQVFRNNEPVALIQVIQSREKNSACDIKSENTPIAVGDSVR
ncbi:MAG: hypothetical protein PHT59_02300 [Candidatus Omnitrophica bacterium]|nr:hypothetical protein [Candidatus Omnitrophota bacterium]